MIARREAIRIAALAVGCISAGRLSVAQTTVHGENSLFVMPGLKVAWAMKRGPSEETTLVVLRVVNVAGTYRSIRMVGIHPFSKQQKILAPPQAFAGEVDFSVPRASFSEFPSAEIHLFRAALPVTGEPDLVVFYLGVPDTAPEFAAAQEAEAYLGKMVGSPK